MSRGLGMDCIKCRPPPRPAHTRRTMEYNTALIGKIAGIEPEEVDISKPGTRRLRYDARDFDFLVSEGEFNFRPA